MGIKSIFTGIFILLNTYFLIINQCQKVLAAPGNVNNLETHRPSRTRPFTRFGSRGTNIGQYPRIKSDSFNEFLVDDDDLFELSKRQTSDDYGHLRFGKRGEELFDDYGHMRFGRSSSNDK